MYHLTDHTHGWNMGGGVRIVYIGWAADGGVNTVNHYVWNKRYTAGLM